MLRANWKTSPNDRAGLTPAEIPRILLTALPLPDKLDEELSRLRVFSNLAARPRPLTRKECSNRTFKRTPRDMCGVPSTFNTEPFLREEEKKFPDEMSTLMN